MSNSRKNSLMADQYTTLLKRLETLREADQTPEIKKEIQQVGKALEDMAKNSDKLEMMEQVRELDRKLSRHYDNLSEAEMKEIRSELKKGIWLIDHGF